MAIRTMMATLLLGLVVAVTTPALADGRNWEYQVVILQGITAGGTIEKLSSGVYIDTKKSATLNALAAEGWEVVAVIGAQGADHTAYLRRKRAR